MTGNYKNITVGYSDEGHGTVLVLLHGFLENRKMWDTFIPDLSAKNRIVTIDLLGHGETGCVGYVHTMEENARMVHQILSSLKIRKCIIGGHSMGGYVALAFAELFPDFVKGMMLINSTSKPDSEERKMNRDRAILAVKQNYTSFVRMSVGNLFSSENRDRLANEIENVKLEALKTPLQGIVASLEGMKLRPDRESVLRDAAFPKLLVLGQKDEVLIYDDAIVQAKLPGVGSVTFPDGHMSSIENRDELLNVMMGFVKSIR